MKILKYYFVLSCALFAYAFSFAQNGYLQQSTLIFSDHKLFQNSKPSAEACDGVIIMGMPLSNSYILGPAGLQGGNASGAVRYYVRNNANQMWTSHSVLPSELAAADNFGTSVGATADHLIVGVRGDDDLGSSSGSALIYGRNTFFPDHFFGDPSKKLLASDGAANDFFGSSVSISNDWALVGAYGNDDLGSSSGSAYLFERNQGGADNWGQVIKLLAPDGAASNLFGQEVKIIDTVAFVSAPAVRKVYIFYQNTGGPNNWGHVKTVTPSISSTNFGQYIAVLNDFLLVGTDAERAFVYEMNAGGANNWGELQVLTPDPGETGQYFGRSVEINKSQDGSTLNIFVGARRMNHKGNDSGAVYWFQRSNADPLIKKKIISASDVGATMEFGYFVLAPESDLFIGRLTTSGEVRHYTAASALGTVAPNITGLTDEYTVADYLTSTLFSQATVVDSDPTNLEASIRLTNPSIGIFGSPFVLQGTDTYYYTGTRDQVNNALRTVIFTPANNLVALENFTSSDLILKIDDFINDSFTDTLSLKTIATNEPPHVSNATLEVYLDQEIGSTIGTIVASDPDVGQGLSFSITNGNSDNLFSINNSGVISLNNLIDPAVHGTSFQLEIRATDNYAIDPKFGIGTATLFLRDSILFNKKIALAPEGVSTAGISFGKYTALSDNFAAVANSGYNGTTPTKLYLYNVSDTGLSFYKELVPQALANYTYGNVLAMNDEWLFLGDPGNDLVASNAGSVAVFHRHAGGNNNWGFVKNITVPTMTSNSYFGNSVCIVNNRLFVSAYLADTGAGNNTGAVFVFYKDQNGIDEWGLEQTIVPDELQTGDNFGENMSISNSGNTLAVCADYDDDSGFNAGATYIFKRDENGVFTQSQKIANPTGIEGAHTKASVQDSTLVIAATTNVTLGRIYEMNSDGNFILNTIIPHDFNYQYPLFFVRAKALNNNQIAISSSRKLQVWQKGWNQNSWGLIQQLDFNDLNSISTTAHKILIGDGGRYSDYPSQNYPNVAGTANVFNLKSGTSSTMTLSLGNAESDRLQETLVPLKISHAEGLAGLQLSMHWNPNILQFIGLENFNLPGLDENSFSVSHAQDGYLTLAWIDPSLTGFTTIEESTIFNIRFKPIGNYADLSAITIDNNPTPLIAVDVNYTNQPVDLVQGSFTINNGKLLSGSVFSINSDPLSEASISVDDSDGVISANHFTNALGMYEIPLVLNDTANVLTLMPTKPEAAVNLDFIDVADIVLVRRHILNVEALESPYQLIAADVVNDGHINIVDIVDLQSVIIGKTNHFFGGKEWAFIPQDFGVDNIQIPIEYPQSVEVPLNTEIPEEINFTAIRVGDVTGGVNQDGGRTSAPKEVAFEYSKPILLSDNRYVVNVTSSSFKNISAFQFTVSWDPNQWDFTDFQSLYLPTAALGKTRIDNGYLAVAWDHQQGSSVSFPLNSTIFSIVLTKKNSVLHHDDVLTFDDQVSRKKAFDSELKLVPLNFTFNPGLQEFDPDTNFYPNPLVSDMVTIRLNSESSGVGTFSIVAASGKLERKMAIPIQEGFNLINFEGLDTLRPGVYVFTLITGKRTIISKILKL